ncbi:Putative NADPH-quinone reductase (modulator of drug activity B) [Paracoccus halophilus]|uniref:NAD(P)H dehydrogenase n=1 Tax=Paracoccus halophilus TaxID=376733 RepID=A0A099F2G6_9RHOB|nr:NAD(P)H-dependent oxidoreductase [Paracoccus halophilus]KGJ04382.1 NAD(P)H dehydrogenase [Paracoccus halophilus]SFA54973.1 Putative NADPH-quinone reductase (modulator of drug activity B) [Paracoccus halophilus]
MRALVVYCHPDPGSFNAAIRDLVCERLRASGAELRLRDLYADDFRPVMSREEWLNYLDPKRNTLPVAAEVEALRWCDTLIFVYPTWWYGLPAMLKGWLDKVMLPDLAFLMPDAENRLIRPGLQHISRLGVFTTCGASFWLTSLIGAPGKRTLLRGVGYLCAPDRRSVFAAHYLMDSSTPDSRARHLEHVARKMDKLLAPM